jgi:hypothetical protein
LKPELRGKDWTFYGGHLYSDHSIREEFFRNDPDKPPSLKSKQWNEEFHYLFNRNERDYIRFVAGEPVPYEEIVRVLGDPNTWRRFDAPPPDKWIRGPQHRRDPEDDARIEALLAECRQWKLSAEEAAAIW